MFKIKNKKALILGLMIIVSIIANGCKKDVEGLVAEVNGEGITQEEYDTEIEVFGDMYKRQYGEDALDQVSADGIPIYLKVQQNILDRLIIEQLIAQGAQEKNIEVTEEEVEETLEELKNSLGGEEQYDEFLEANGIPKEYFKNSTRKGILIDKFHDNYMKSTEIDDKEVAKFFEENKEELVVVSAKHILLNNEEDAKNVLERLNNGEKFEEVALTESLDSVSAARGGDLGYFTRGGMGKELSEATFALEVGEVSDIVKTDVGYHIIKLEDRKDTIEDLGEQIAMSLKEQKYQNYVNELRKKADIKVFIDFEQKAKDAAEDASKDSKSEDNKEDKKDNKK